MRQKAKVVGTDLLGVLCIIGAILFGWIPGPGGIPLFLAGLGFFSINHRWAKRLLGYFKKHGVHVMTWLFPTNKTIRMLYDAASVAMFISSVYFFYNRDKYQFYTAASISLFLLSITILLYNRNRLDNFKRYIATKFGKKS